MVQFLLVLVAISICSFFSCKFCWTELSLLVRHLMDYVDQYAFDRRMWGLCNISQWCLSQFLPVHIVLSTLPYFPMCPGVEFSRFFCFRSAFYLTRLAHCKLTFLCVYTRYAIANWMHSSNFWKILLHARDHYTSTSLLCRRSLITTIHWWLDPTVFQPSIHIIRRGSLLSLRLCLTHPHSWPRVSSTSWTPSLSPLNQCLQQWDLQFSFGRCHFVLSFVGFYWTAS